MNVMPPLVMADQANDLGNVLRDETRPIDKIVRNVLSPLEFKSLKQVFTTGDGDSYHATMATEMAFKSIASIRCEPMSAMRFLEYGADYIKSSFPNDTLVVGISASGRTERVAQALERANKRSKNIITAVLSGDVDGRIGEQADRKISVKLPDKGRSPGVRTYNASLMGLLLLAIRIGEIQDRYHQTEVTANFVFDDDLPEGHLPAFLGLVRDRLDRVKPKGCIYLSPLRFGQPSRAKTFGFNRLKVLSRVPTFLYIIQRL